MQFLPDGARLLEEGIRSNVSAIRKPSSRFLLPKSDLSWDYDPLASTALKEVNLLVVEAVRVIKVKKWKCTVGGPAALALSSPAFVPSETLECDVRIFAKAIF